MRIGINTGPVVVGAIGRDLRMDYTAVGDTTNLAARLLSVARSGQIVVSRYTQHLRDGFFVFEDLGEFELKGKTHPVRAFALKGEVRGQTRLEVSKARGLTPLIGRAAELARLNEAQRRSAEGGGLVLLLVGEPGQGKSRLLYEFLQGLTAVEIIEASCLSYGGSIPYHPILEALRRYFELTDGMAEDETRRRLAEGLGTLGLDEPTPCPAGAWPSCWATSSASRCRRGSSGACKRPSSRSRPWRCSGPSSSARASGAPSCWSSRTCTGPTRAPPSSSRRSPRRCPAIASCSCSRHARRSAPPFRLRNFASEPATRARVCHPPAPCSRYL